MIWKECRRIYFHRIHFIRCSVWALGKPGLQLPLHLFHVLNLYVFCSLYPIHGQQNIQIDLFWQHTAFSRAYKINSVRSLYRLTCLRTNTHITTHGHCFLAQCFSPSLPPCLTHSPPQLQSSTLLAQSRNIQYDTRQTSTLFPRWPLLNSIAAAAAASVLLWGIKNWSCQSLGC